MTRLSLVLLLLLALGTACSSFNVNVPAITDQGQQLPGKIVWHELLTDTPAETRVFYSELFGWEFEALPDKRINYTLIRHGGRAIGGMIDQTRLPTDADISQWVALIAVSDIESAVEAVRSGGGTVFTPPTSLGDRGRIAVVADSQGALSALLQSEGGEPADSTETPAVGDFLWDELWTGDPVRAAAFYATLAAYEVEQKTLGVEGDSVNYQVLSAQGEVRAGIRANPFPDAPPVWVNYLRMADRAALDAVLAEVEALGGKVLVPAVQRPGGGTVAMIAGPSGAGIALQTWSEGQVVSEIEEEQ